MLFHLQIIMVEEKFLIKTFGDDYLYYCKSVKRYIGKLLCNKTQKDISEVENSFNK